MPVTPTEPQRPASAVATRLPFLRPSLCLETPQKCAPLLRDRDQRPVRPSKPHTGLSIAAPLTQKRLSCPYIVWTLAVIHNQLCIGGAVPWGKVHRSAEFFQVFFLHHLCAMVRSLFTGLFPTQSSQPLSRNDSLEMGSTRTSVPWSVAFQAAAGQHGSARFNSRQRLASQPAVLAASLPPAPRRSRGTDTAHDGPQEMRAGTRRRTPGAGARPAGRWSPHARARILPKSKGIVPAPTWRITQEWIGQTSSSGGYCEPISCATSGRCHPAWFAWDTSVNGCPPAMPRSEHALSRAEHVMARWGCALPRLGKALPRPGKGVSRRRHAVSLRGNAVSLADRGWIPPCPGPLPLVTPRRFRREYSGTAGMSGRPHWA